MKKSRGAHLSQRTGAGGARAKRRKFGDGKGYISNDMSSMTAMFGETVWGFSGKPEFDIAGTWKEIEERKSEMN